MLTSLLIVAVLGCIPRDEVDEKIASANGRFVLEVTARTMALRQKGAGTPRWSLDSWYRGTYVVADSGEWVAEFRAQFDDQRAELVVYDAKGKSTELRPLEQLSEEEQQFLPFSDCGSGWFQNIRADGDVITIEVPQGGNRRPTEAPGPTLSFKIDARHGTFTRSDPIPRPSISELIAVHQGDGKTSGAFELLTAKAMLKVNRGDRELCSFFATVARGTEVRPRELAIQSLTSADCRTELAALSSPGPRDDLGDVDLLSGLARTDPDAASRFAMEALRGRKNPPLLRSRAAALLIEKSKTLRWEAARLALSDEASVRAAAISQVKSLPRSQEAFTILLAASIVPGEAMIHARYAALDYLQAPKDPIWAQQFAEAWAAGKLDAWNGAAVVAAGLAEQRGEPAEELYRRGVTRLEGQKEKLRDMDEELWCEAKLRLAQLAAAQGNKELAVALATEVMTSGTSAMVAAPQPNRYSGGHASRGALGVAKEIVTAGGVPPPPQPTIQDEMKQMREIRQRMEEQRARRNASQPQK